VNDAVGLGDEFALRACSDSVIHSQTQTHMKEYKATPLPPPGAPAMMIFGGPYRWLSMP
jgi:hypothetical protein